MNKKLTTEKNYVMSKMRFISYCKKWLQCKNI
jgi:hypothetical protein